ncbi:MAG: hypothetical protein JXR25_05065 [Pontiellaceae bacterium]|nr:hypothetical protein [Pontiellaceae bacterium]MBN2784178.1 hypothetical protein [Pontiellaceae bacterium]
MSKFAVMLGFILCAPILGGVAYMVGSHVATQAEAEAVQESLVTYNRMLAEIQELRTQRRFSIGQERARTAIENATSKQMRAAAGYLMGALMYEEWRAGGDAPMDAAVAYLKAARNLTGSPTQRAKIGLQLLDTLEAMGELEKYSACLDELLSTAVAFDEEIALWERRFDYLLGHGAGWEEVNAALEEAKGINIDWAEWKDLLADVHLRMDERILENAEWYEAYVAAQTPDKPADSRADLFASTRSRLKGLSVSADEHQKEASYLRMARLMHADGRSSEAYQLLEQFVNMRPEVGIAEALDLLCTISSNEVDLITAVPIARNLLHLLDINAMSQDGIIHVVDQLEQMELYPEALGVLDSRLSLIEHVGRNQGPLVARSAALNERLGDRHAALETMGFLQGLECNRWLGRGLCDIVDLNLAKGDYTSVEEWVEAYVGRLTVASDARAHALYALYEAKYWQDRPLAEQLFVGATALESNPDHYMAQSVELRMAHSIENEALYSLAVSYYNRIGLLSFFQGEVGDDSASQNVGEQAVLGKARCLKKLGDWVAANQLYRNICRRTRSPLVKSEAAVGWAEIALKENQQREALRRYNLVHVQMLSETDQVRYMLGRMRFDDNSRLVDSEVMEANLELLANLPEDEQCDATVTFFNETFESLQMLGDEDAMMRMIDLACQSTFADSLPISSYVLRMFSGRIDAQEIDSLGAGLRKLEGVADASVGDLVKDVDRLGNISELVKGL